YIANLGDDAAVDGASAESQPGSSKPESTEPTAQRIPNRQKQALEQLLLAF
ncbi:hypothetical protein H4R35_002590, partial [Dimargaris xerosporica]